MANSLREEIVEAFGAVSDCPRQLKAIDSTIDDACGGGVAVLYPPEISRWREPELSLLLEDLSHENRCLG